MSYRTRRRRRRSKTLHLLELVLLSMGSAAFVGFTLEGTAAAATGSGVVYANGGFIWGLVSVGLGLFSLCWFLAMAIAVLLGRLCR